MNTYIVTPSHPSGIERILTGAFGTHLSPVKGAFGSIGFRSIAWIREYRVRFSEYTLFWEYRIQEYCAGFRSTVPASGVSGVLASGVDTWIREYEPCFGNTPCMARFRSTGFRNRNLDAGVRTRMREYTLHGSLQEYWLQK